MNAQLTANNIRSDGVRFTLIEMLVVIAIISILASMLAPALQNALNSAKSVQCMNNLKQQNIAINMYDNDLGERPYALKLGTVAEAGWPANINAKWYALLYKNGYLEVTGALTAQGADGRNCDILLCPTQPGPIETSYVMNVAYFNMLGIAYGSSYLDWAKTPCKASRIPSPSKRAYILDGRGGVYSVSFKYNMNYPHGMSSMYVTEANYQSAPYDLVTNALYLDGHSSSLSFAEFSSDSRTICGWDK